MIESNKTKIEKIISFILITAILTISFTITYSKYIKSKIECFYISLSCQTFSGTNVEKYKDSDNLKVIIVTQQSVSFIITVLFSYYIFMN